MRALRPYYVRKRFDVPYPVLMRGIARCFLRPDATSALAEAEARWTPTGCAVAVLSVRTAFDAMLATCDWPAGSEVLMSAVTIPHMVDLVREHGYVPVPVEVDLDTMEPRAAAVRAAMNERTRAFVLTHLFGASLPTGPWRKLCDEADLLFVEDRAQAFDGVDFDLGLADVALYSFGTIKTTTCFGGGVALFGDSKQRDAVRAHIAGHPSQPTSEYLRKLAQYAVLIPLSGPRVYPLFCVVLEALTGDYDAVVRKLTRGFPDSTLCRRIRRRPCGALAAMLAERLSAQGCSARARGDAVARAFSDPPVGLRHLGRRSPRHTHWLVPLESRDPAALIAACRAIGLDATTGSSTLASHKDGSASREAMAHVVYVPVYPEIPEATLSALLTILDVLEGDVGRDSQAA